MAISLSHWRRRYDNDSRVPYILSRFHPEKSRTIGSRLHRLREIYIYFFEACLFDRVEPRHQPDIHRWKPGGSSNRNKPIFCTPRKYSLTRRTPLEAEGKAIQGRTPGDPTRPVGASPLSGQQAAITSSPNTEKEEGEVTPSDDADIPDSIARALLDALQEKQTGNQLPATRILLARVRASQLQQATGKEPSEGTIQATLDLISLGQEPSRSISLADKVSTLSHTLEYTSNQPSTAVPPQMNSSRRGLTPTADAETTGSLYTAIANSGNIFPQLTRNPISEYTHSQHQVTSFRMSANDTPLSHWRKYVSRSTCDSQRLPAYPWCCTHAMITSCLVDISLTNIRLTKCAIDFGGRRYITTSKLGAMTATLVNGVNHRIVGSSYLQVIYPLITHFNVLQ